MKICYLGFTLLTTCGNCKYRKSQFRSKSITGYKYEHEVDLKKSCSKATLPTEKNSKEAYTGYYLFTSI